MRLSETTASLSILTAELALVLVPVRALAREPALVLALVRVLVRVPELESLPAWGSVMVLSVYCWRTRSRNSTSASAG